MGAEMLGEMLVGHARIIRLKRFGANSSALASAASSRGARSAALASAATTPAPAVLAAASATSVAPAASASTAAMFPELRGDPPYLAFGVREYLAILLRFVDFVGRPRFGELLLKILERVRAHRSALTPQDHEAHRPVQRRNLSF